MALPETEVSYRKWSYFFRLFNQSVDYRTGSLLHLPFSGGLLDQPSRTMTILTTIQEVFLSKLAKHPTL